MFFFAHDARAQTATGYTSIDYDESTNIVDAYSETDEDYDVESAYGAYVSLSVHDQNWNLMGSQTETDDGSYGFAAAEIEFFGSPDMTYTARGMHKALAQQYDYDTSFGLLLRGFIMTLSTSATLKIRESFNHGTTPSLGLAPS